MNKYFLMKNRHPLTDLSKVQVNKFYYQEGLKIYSMDLCSTEVKEESLDAKTKPGYNCYELFKDYTADKEGIQKYMNDFDNWVNELKPHGLNYEKYFTHGCAVNKVFMSKAREQIDGLQLDTISFKEAFFFEQCSNGGIISLDDTYKNKVIDAYGYDFSAFYPNMLLKIILATKQGKRKKIKTIDYNNLRYGIYRVKITTDDQRFKKIFSFSRNNFYTHYSLKLAHKYKDIFNINMELIIDDKYNALIYDDENLVQSKEVFQTWFNFLSDLKQKFPKNKLIKHLMSSLWGHITQYNRKFFSDEDFADLDFSDITEDEKTEYKLLYIKRFVDETQEFGVKSRYEMVPTEQPYLNNLARIKPFLVSYCRSYVADLIMKENILDNVVRIHTDGIVLNKQHDFTHLKYYPKPEDKTTGKIIFKSVNNYEKV